MTKFSLGGRRWEGVGAASPHSPAATDIYCIHCVCNGSAIASVAFAMDAIASVAFAMDAIAENMCQKSSVFQHFRIHCVCNGCYCIRCVCNGCNSRSIAHAMFEMHGSWLFACSWQWQLICSRPPLQGTKNAVISPKTTPIASQKQKPDNV